MSRSFSWKKSRNFSWRRNPNSLWKKNFWTKIWSGKKWWCPSIRKSVFPVNMNQPVMR